MPGLVTVFTFLMIAFDVAEAASLEEYVLNTVLNNPQIKKSQAELNAAQERVNQAVASIRPQIGLSMSRAKVSQDRKDQGFPIRSQNYITESDSLLLQQPLYRPKLLREYKKMKVEKKAQEYDYLGARNELVMQVIELYISYIRAINTRRITEKKIALLEEQMLASNKMYSSGRGTITEIAEIRASLDKSNVELISVEQQIKSTLSELFFISGLDSQTEVQEIKKYENLNVFDNVGLDDWKKQALQANFKIQGIEKRIEAASVSLASEKYSRYPTLDLTVELSKGASESTFFVNSETENKSIGFNFYLPIFSGGRITSRIKQLSYILESERENMRYEISEVEKKVQRAYYGLNQSLKLNKALNTAVNSAEIQLEATKKSALAGLRRTLDVLISQQKLISVEKELNNSVMDVIIYWANLKMLSSNLEEQTIKQISNFLYRGY